MGFIFVLSYVIYEHDALNRITAVYDHDSTQVPLDPDTWFKDVSVVPTQMQYNPLGQMTSISRPNDIDSSYIYGDASIAVDVSRNQNPYQIYSIVHQDTETTPVTLGQYDYSYDAAGNRSGMNVTASDGSQTNITYDYDRANRLIEESYLLIGGATSTTSYQYDRAGNRSQMIESSGDITQYVYDDNDQLTRVNLPNYFFEDYSYDTRGNLTSIQLFSDGVIDTAIGNPTLFEYDARDLLSRIELPTTERIDYEYDYRGNRVRQEQVGSQDPTVYLWDEFSRFGDVILETGVNFTDGALYHKMNYTIAAGQLISQTDDADLTRYFLSDAQGTTRALTDSTGLVTSEFTYDAFGNLDEGIDPLSTETDYLYTGQQFDGYSELYSMRARYYDPTQGRFMTRDTYAYNYQNPVELNRYVYGANNPVRYSDPSGHNTLALAVRLIGNTVVGAATGALGGFTSGILMGTVQVLMASTGMCGNDLTSLFSGSMGDRAVNLSSYVLKMGMIGAAVGAVVGAGVGFFGGMVGSGIGPATVLRTTAAVNGVGLGFSINQFIQNPNPCTAAEVAVEMFDIGMDIKSSAKLWEELTEIVNRNGHGGSSPGGVPDGNGSSGTGNNGTVDVDTPGGIIRACNNSFSADTTVQTSDGDIPISEIDIGDTVIAYDEVTGETGEYTVTDTINHEDDQIAYVTINGEEIETTPWHLFYTSDGWLEAGDLQEGDSIVSLGGVYGTVESVIIVDAVQTMYDLTVEEVHTFAVGDGDWVVHNAKRCGASVQQGAGSFSEFLQKGSHVNATINGKRAGELTLLPHATRQEIYVHSTNSPNTASQHFFRDSLR